MSGTDKGPSGTARPRTATGTPDLGALLRQGLQAHQQGRLDEASALYGHVLAASPAQPQANHLLGLVQHQLGDNTAARQSIERALAATPQDPLRLADLGMVFNALRRPLEALDQLRQALHFRPGDVRILNLMATSYIALGGRNEDAAGCYRQAIRSEPGNALMHNNLGNVLAVMGEIEAGIDSYRQAIAIDPGYVDARSNLGYALAGLGRLDEAIIEYDEALRLRPDHVGALLNRGLALTRRGRLEEAGETFRRALALNPRFVEVLLGYGDALVHAGRTAEGLAQYRLGLERRPGFAPAQSCLLFVHNYLADHTPEETLAEARRYGEMVANPAATIRGHRNDPDPHRRIRVGLVSGDLYTHAVTSFLQSVLPEIDRNGIELFAYSATHSFDGVTERLKRSVPNWRRVASYSDDALVGAILADRIDVLIDLSGHSSRNRLSVFARKPAPVQVTWLGYSGTSGVPGMDYIIADGYVAPPGAEGQFSETVWRLPDSYLCFTPPLRSPAVAPLPVLARGQLTFGSFNTINKISGPAMAAWAKVLAAVPDSRLLLKNRLLEVADARVVVEQGLREAGIAPDRYELMGHVADDEGHLAVYGQVDIALDPFPYNGTTTSCEAMWMGVPVLTLGGDRFIARVGESLVRTVGLDDWVAADVDDYARKAAMFAADLPALAALRSRLRQQLAASPLMDAPRFAGNLEAAIRGMWQKWCEAQTGVSEASRLA